MPSEYCPFCRIAANMRITVTSKETGGNDGKLKMLAIKTYHCESCGSFVRSIDEEEGRAPAAVRDLGERRPGLPSCLRFVS